MENNKEDEAIAHNEQINQLLRGERPFTINDDGERVYMRWEEFKVKRRMAKKIVKEKLEGTWIHKSIEYKLEKDANGINKQVVIHHGTYNKEIK